VEQLDVHTCHARFIYKGTFVTSARDFSLLLHWSVQDDDSVLVLSFSIDDAAAEARCPVTESHVRATLFLGGWVLRPLPPTPRGQAQTQCTYVSQVHLGGNVPSFLQNAVAKEQPMTVAALRGIVREIYKGRNSVRRDDRPKPRNQTSVYPPDDYYAAWKP
jgi:hypothetical protein